MLHYTTVDPRTLELLNALMQLPSLRDTRLVGGTALALQIGHRKSVDLDLFGNITVDDTSLIEELKTLGDLVILKNSSCIHVFILNNVKVDVVNYQYVWLDSFLEVDNIRMGSLKDIAAMKLSAITGRGTKKDFVDLYFLTSFFSLSEMLDFYENKYPDGSLFMVLKSLSYFEDAENDPSPFMLKNIKWEDVKLRIASLL